LVWSIELEGLGARIIALPNETLYEALQRHGYRMRVSCRNGVCEICEIRLLQGEIEQRYPKQHLCLTEDDNQGGKPILACTSRPLSDVRVKIEGVRPPGVFVVKKLRCDITSIEKLNSDVYRVRLHLPATGTLAAEFYAGQYLDVLLPDGRQASFSIGSAPEQGRDLELHIRHMPDSEMSCAILAYLQNNPSVEIELPKGNCYLQATRINPRTRLIFAAASTGFAQVKSVVEHLLANQYSNPIYLYWGARVEEDLYLERLPEQWANEHPHVHFIPVVSQPENSPGWQGRCGLINDAILEDFASVEDVEVFASGSPAMVYALLDSLETRGFSASQMHSDVFAYAPRPAKS